MPDTLEVLQQLSSVPMATVSLGGTGQPPLPDGFGALLPRDEGFRMLGAVHVSAMVPERAPAGHWLVTVYLGGRHDPKILDLDDADLQELARRELSQLAGRVLSVSMGRVYRHPRGIPQPDLRSPRALKALQDDVGRRPGLNLAGSYLGGVSVEVAVRSGLEAAAQVREELAA
tara:strand:- start:1 stop:519 length:519 start_codon:yes stop_codon:yes gene_type:complete